MAMIENILTRYKRIAIIGLSSDPFKDSYIVAKYLQDNGYKIYPVNPNAKEILGEKCYKNLLEIPDEIEIVDIFRLSEEIGTIVDHAIYKGVKVIWMQEGIANLRAAKKARKFGIKVFMNMCIMKEHKKLKEKTTS
jgi:hypothetical protein